MIASRNSAPSCRRAALLAALVLALVPPAAAQTGRERVGAPIQLRPGGAEPPGAPSGITVESSSPTQRPLAGARARGGTGDIQIDRLKALEASAIGLLDERNGGLGLRMWAASDLGLIKQLLAKLPMGTGSPSMQSLSRRLLLTTAELPGPEGEGPSLLALRLDRLAAGGQLAEINELMKRVPEAAGDPALMRTRLDALWLAGETTEACGLSLNLVTGSTDPLWQKAAAFCHALEGEPARAELYEQLLLEDKHDDPAFFALLAALLGRGGKPLASLPAPTALQIAMLNAVKWPLPDDALEAAGPLVLTSLVGAAALAPERRLEAAERAAARGALSVEALRQLYEAMSLPAASPEQALALARKQPGAASNALLYQLARVAARPVDKARLLQAALGQARAAGRFPLAARVNAPTLQLLTPVPGLAFLAAEAGQALLLAGDFDGAMAWLKFAYDDGSPESRRAVLSLWPLVLVADGEARVPFDATRFADWWRARDEAPDEGWQARAGLLLSALGALGRHVDGATWRPLYAGAGLVPEPTPSPALAEGLDRAAEGVRAGETVLFVLLNLGSGGPAEASPATVAQTIRALRRLGLEQDARALALEALLARDLAGP